MATSIKCKRCGASWAGHSERQARLNRTQNPCGCPEEPEKRDARRDFTARSLELRWIGSGPAEDEVRTWFESLPGEIRVEPRRVDQYICPGTWTQVGLKVRQGRLEVKAIDGPTQEFDLPGQGEGGIAERWTKWSVESAEAGRWAEDLRMEPDILVSVSKVRAIRFYGWNGLALGPVEKRRHEGGVSVELADLDHADGRFWTVCIESFGAAGPAMEERLPLLIGYFLTENVPSAFRRDACKSYPEWIEESRS
ncbi:MAG: hypothetical protein AAF682_15035 [Planctomycetota bacterium]